MSLSLSVWLYRHRIFIRFSAGLTIRIRWRGVGGRQSIGTLELVILCCPAAKSMWSYWLWVNWRRPETRFQHIYSISKQSSGHVETVNLPISYLLTRQLYNTRQSARKNWLPFDLWTSSRLYWNMRNVAGTCHDKWQPSVSFICIQNSLYIGTISFLRLILICVEIQVLSNRSVRCCV